jgi:hypothetical protein
LVAVKRLAIIFAAVVIGLALVVPGLRKVLLIAGAVILGVVLLIVLQDREPDQTSPSGYQAGPPQPPIPPPKPIAPSSIEVRDIRTDFPGYGRQISRVTVRIVNETTNDTLKKIDFRLLIADCKAAADKAAKPSEDCVTVHDETGSFDYLSIPPQQGRDASLTVRNLGVTILGSPRIDLTVTAAQAQ